VSNIYGDKPGVEMVGRYWNLTQSLLEKTRNSFHILYSWYKI